MTDEFKKILVVEDDTSIMKVEVYALKEEGFKVDMARNGAEALELIKKNDYGVILLDLVMPKRTGFDVMHDLKLHGNKVPILVFSNMTEAVSKEEALRLGARDYFHKNKIDLDELVEKVKKFIS